MRTRPPFTLSTPVDRSASLLLPTTGAFFVGPSLASTWALMEPSSTPLPWPYIVGPSSAPPGTSGGNGVATSAAAWALSLEDDASASKLAKVLMSGSEVYLPDVLGAPGACAAERSRCKGSVTWV